MRPDTILINDAPGETRIALMAGDHVIELLHARAGDAPVEGALFAGRVTQVNRDLNAAFVDIGGAAPGFLAASDLRRTAEERIKSVADVLAEGDRVLVQADREAMDGKGPRLTCRMALAGRFMNLLTAADGLKFPRGLEKGARAQLEALAEYLPAGMSAAFNPAAGGAKHEALKAELIRLVDELDQIYDAFEGAAKVPALLRPAPSALARALANAAPDCRVLVDTAEAAEMVAALPGAPKAEHQSGQTPLFDAEGIEEAIEAALDPVVHLPSGGRIIISETPALTAIDVDTGRASEGAPRRLAAKTNGEAVTAIARALRLRNLSGQILIDFLALKGKKERNDLLARLRNALAADPVESHVLGMTGLGLVELTRRRRGPSLAARLGAAGEWRPSAETAALAALRQASAMRGGRIVLCAAPDVAGVLQGSLKEALENVQARLGGALTLAADERLGAGEFELSQ